MVSALDSGSSGSGSSPDRGHCVVFLNKTLSPPIKWVPTNLILGVTLRWTRFPSRGSRNILVTSCYRNRDKLRPDGPLGSVAVLRHLTRCSVPWHDDTRYIPSAVIF